MKPKKPCRYPNCPNLTDGSYCENHKPLMDKKRMSPAERGYDSRWRKARKVFLSEHPYINIAFVKSVIKRKMFRTK